MLTIGICLLGFKAVFAKGRVMLPTIFLLTISSIVYVINFKMAADKLFKKPNKLNFGIAGQCELPQSALVIGIEHNGITKAYPIRYLTYHHQVQDNIAGQPVLVTYCSVCRTGRVFVPEVEGKLEEFRLVGMDNFNAMLEDSRTCSWWRQATGEAVAGKLKGEKLKEFPSMQSTLGQWRANNPHGLVMLPDSASQNHYDKDSSFENGTSNSKLTGTVWQQWQPKSWVVGIEYMGKAKAYSWNRLLKERIINDTLNGKTIVVAIAKNNTDFVAFERNSDQHLLLRNDTLIAGNSRWQLNGHSWQKEMPNLVRIQCYQEFWHSWLTFHRESGRY
jgi:hypothetical protein